MASKQKRVDEAKKRDKRSKIALLALGVVLMAVAAYEVPSMLKVMNKKAPPGSTYDPGPSSVVPGLPDVAVGATPTAKAPSGQLVDTDVPPTSSAGQLVTFEVFQTKNPFVPQVTTASGTTDTSAPTSTVPTALNPPPNVPTSATPTSTKLNSAVPSAGGSSAAPTADTPPTTTPPTTTTPVPPAAPTVTIAVNGVATRVGVAGTFPAGVPVFRLVSFQTGTVQIGIVGGSYAAGGATLTLQVGHPVTLQNTTDGKQYKLELLKTP